MRRIGCVVHREYKPVYLEPALRMRATLRRSCPRYRREYGLRGGVPPSRRGRKGPIGNYLDQRWAALVATSRFMRQQTRVGLIIAGFLLLSRQEAPTFGAPCQCPFHYPAARRRAFFPMRIEPFLLDAPEMRHLLGGGDGVMAGRAVIALVEAEGLGLRYRRLGAFSHDGFQGRRQ
jgi:hypothetical protein